MPGSPAVSPRLLIPRYDNLDGVNFAGQVNAVTDAIDAAAAKDSEVVKNDDSRILNAVQQGGAAALVSATISNPGGTSTTLQDTLALLNKKYSRLFNSGGSTYLQSINDAYTVVQKTLFEVDHTNGIVRFPQNISRPLLTAFPTTDLRDGQEVLIQTTAMRDLGVVWAFRYSTAQGSHRWEFIGGPDMYHEIDYGESLYTTDGTWRNLGTVGPIITLPLSGIYFYDLFCSAHLPSETATVLASAGISINDTNPATDQWVTWSNGSTLFGAHASLQGRIINVGSGSTVRIKYATSPFASTFVRRRLRIRPIRMFS